MEERLRVKAPEETKSEKEIALSIKDVEISYKVIRPKRLRELLSKQTTDKYFKAINGVSFDIHAGDVVAVIGQNGSGKSTLLRAIAGIYAPDTGTIETYGRTAGLMAIGIGFQNDLSGRDNIYLSCMLYGFSKKQIDEKVGEIIEFSELEDFIENPVKTYSSGMHSKLAFAITAIMETDILLIDETLSVGDRNFRKKSAAKIKSIIEQENKTVMIVSHNMKELYRMCNRAVWIHDGMLRREGDCKPVLKAYERFMDRKEQKNLKRRRDRCEKKEP